MNSSSGPLAGIRVVEFAGIGPAPMAAMLLADLGAEIISIERLEGIAGGILRPRRFDVFRRGRRSLAIDLKQAAGRDCVLDLIAGADALIEGFRPGVMERLGLGPEPCTARNPRLVYGRVTGWGQEGPLAHAAGHDLNYIAVSGALAQMGREGEPPTIPLNLIGDNGGGGMLLAFGIVCALLDAVRSGKGQTVDSAMTDGAATLMGAIYGMAGAGIHKPQRGSNVLDGGAPFYNVYQCSDGGWVTIAPIEPKFRLPLLAGMGFDPATFPDLDDPAQWDEAKRLFTLRFAERSRDEWCKVLLGTDACFAPMLTIAEAPEFAQNLDRATFVEIAGVFQPAPSPRFSRTPPAMPEAPDEPGASTHAVLRDWGISAQRIASLEAEGVIAAA